MVLVTSPARQLRTASLRVALLRVSNAFRRHKVNNSPIIATLKPCFNGYNDFKAVALLRRFNIKHIELSMRSILMAKPYLGLLFAVLASSASCSLANADDFVVTIGGGYVPQQNQASLEANVSFFQRFLRERVGIRSHQLFFADGSDPKPDLQVLAPASAEDRPVSKLLTRLHRRGPSAQQVVYRNHDLQEVVGATHANDIHQAISAIAKQSKSGDRILVYVTAHGKAGPKRLPQNTSISCWDNEEISVKQLSEWLNEVPVDVPVILVMAQCYAGGFANTIFESIDERNKLAPQVRVGFFAQQSDLPAAGCRPDIEHDQEFSSYFWGALVGETRNGQPVESADANHDGVVSFDEAFAYAVIAGETIDIPLKSSDVLLRQFSTIPNYVSFREVVGRTRDRQEGDSEDETEINNDMPNSNDLFAMRGSIRTIIESESPVNKSIVTDLCNRLEIGLDRDVSELISESVATLRNPRGNGNGPPFGGVGGGRGPRGNPARKELLDQIEEKWPDLADPEHWTNSNLLSKDNQSSLFDQLRALPAYANFEQRIKDREVQRQRAEVTELRSVKLRRLIETIELIVLARNLLKFAEPNVIARYQAMRAIENGSMNWKMGTR